MHYYIDGYNFLFRYRKAGDNLQEQRKKLLSDLNTKVKLINLDVTIVFDAHYESSDFSRSHFESLEIIFTSFGQTADELILHELEVAKYPNLHSVVTSDKKLAYQVKGLYAQTETVENFLQELNKRYKNKLKRAPLPKPTKKVQDRSDPEKSQEQEIKKSEYNLPPPSPQDSPEDCFAYYLETFEKRYYEELSQSKKIKKKPNTRENRKGNTTQ